MAHAHAASRRARKLTRLAIAAAVLAGVAMTARAQQLTVTQDAPEVKSPDKRLVWLDASKRSYACPGDRGYGKTNGGTYLPEARAKALGAQKGTPPGPGVWTDTCFR